MSQDLSTELQRARRRFDAGKVEEAARLCRKLARRFARQPQPLVALAEVERSRGHIDKALEALAEAVKRAPRDLMLWTMLGDSRLAASRFAEAADAFRHARRLDPGELALTARLAAALQQAGELDEAIRLHEEVVAATPTDAFAHFNLATALKRQHRFAAALEAYRRAAELAPQDTDLRMSLAATLIETEHFEEAAAALDQVVTREPRNVEALHALAYASKKLRRGAAGVAATTALMQASGEDFDALVAHSTALIAAARYDEALEFIDRGLAIEPASRQLLSDAAIAYAALDIEEAARFLVDPDKLLRPFDIDAPAGYASVDEFNAALLTHIETHPTLDFSGISLSCHEGTTSDEVFVEPLGPVGTLAQTIRACARRYQDDLERDQAHPWTDALPDVDELHLSGWVTRLRSQGFQHGHIHPTAWLSGVYYISLPPEVDDETRDGWIEFGRVPYWYGEGTQGVLVPVRPLAGRLVLFPSYFYHRTIAFESSDERLTLAFDFRDHT